MIPSSRFQGCGAGRRRLAAGWLAVHLLLTAQLASLPHPVSSGIPCDGADHQHATAPHDAPSADGWATQASPGPGDPLCPEPPEALSADHHCAHCWVQASLPGAGVPASGIGAPVRPASDRELAGRIPSGLRTPIPPIRGPPLSTV